MELFTAPVRTNDGEASFFGIGWGDRTLARRHWIGHGGSHVGATAELWYEPQSGLVIALLTNTNSPALDQPLEELATLFSPGA